MRIDSSLRFARTAVAAWGLILAVACSSSSSPSDNGAAGNGGASGQQAIAGRTGTAGKSAGEAGKTGAGTAGAAGSPAAAGNGGAAGSVAVDAGSPDASPMVGKDTAPPVDAMATTARTSPACGGKFNESPNKPPTAEAVKMGIYECDSIGTSLDFEPDAKLDRKAGSGAALSKVVAGTGFGDAEINQCAPYCYTHNFAIGLDMVASQQSSLKNEVVINFDKPLTGYKANEFFLMWFRIDAVAEQPAFKGFRVKAFLQNDKGDKTYIGDDQYLADARFPPEYKALGTGAPKPIKSGGFYELKAQMVKGDAAALTNVAGIGLSVEPVSMAAGEEWHGRVYIDHARYGTTTP